VFIYNTSNFISPTKKKMTIFDVNEGKKNNRGKSCTRLRKFYNCAILCNYTSISRDKCVLFSRLITLQQVTVEDMKFVVSRDKGEQEFSSFFFEKYYIFCMFFF